MMAAGQVGTESLPGVGRWMDGGEMGGKFHGREGVGVEEMKFGRGRPAVRLPLSLMGNLLQPALKGHADRRRKPE